MVEEPRAGSALQNDNPQIEHTTVTLEMSEDLIELIKMRLRCRDVSTHTQLFTDPRQKGRLEMQDFLLKTLEGKLLWMTR